ncbi:lysozyme inhibitor LprI family protein [Coraliomargarita sp. W4R72]
MGEGSTASVVVGTSEAKELWKREIQRVYNRLRYEFPEHVAEIDKAEASWETYYTAQLKVIGIANDKQGSLYGMSAAEERLKLVRDHALSLARWGRY